MTDDGRAGIDAALVRALVAEQFPHWAHLRVSPVPVDGWDNRTYRLGETLSVRLPTAAGYAPAVLEEHRWLPWLAPRLPLPVPVPVGLGRPGQGYPHPWSVRRWLPGETVARSAVDLVRVAASLADFLACLRSLETAGVRRAGPGTAFRGASLAVYDEETRACLDGLAGRVPAARLLAVWEAALGSTWDRPDRWFHGDVAAGNLLAREGRLSAVIDFGTCGVGDPACDLVIAWTLLDDPARRVFRAGTDLDDETWARGRGWALWKALLGLREDPGSARDRAVLDRVLAEHERGPA